MTGDEREQLHERHDASDFELRTEDKIAESPGRLRRAGRRDLAPVAVEKVGREHLQPLTGEGLLSPCMTRW